MTAPIGTNTKLIIDEFQKLGWQSEQIFDNFIITSKEGLKPILFHATLNEMNSAIGYEFAQNKFLLYRLGEKLGWSVPATVIHEDDESSLRFLNIHKKIVVKPSDSDHGKGISTGVITGEQLTSALSLACEHSETVLLQQHCEGSDYRFFVLNDNVVAVSERKPANVVGDGRHTVKQLVSTYNSYLYRGKYMISIAEVEHFGGRSLLSYKPTDGESVVVLGVSNVSRGGNAEDRTGMVHESYLEFVIQVARMLDLKVTGIDMLIQDITAEMNPKNYVLIEVNKMPGLVQHDMQSNGQSLGVASKIVDALIVSRQSTV